jgi:hypothetical protein
MYKGLVLVFSMISLISPPPASTQEKSSKQEVLAVCQIAAHPSDYVGKIIRVRGEVGQWPHDLALWSDQCDTEKIVIAYPGEQSVKPPVDFELRRDQDIKKFERLLVAKNKDGGYRYAVAATFTGRLDISETVGFVRDEAGKVRGIQGYGHPFPFSRFQLVVQSVSDVAAIPYEQAAKAGGPAVLFAVAPVYSDVVAALPEGGEAVIEVTIDTYGSVIAAKPVWGNPVLHEPSLKAAKRWVFDTSGEKNRKAKLTFSYRVVSNDAAPDELTPVFTLPYGVEVRRKLAEPGGPPN